ncbi:MAG: PepSY-associated TM helix domain-containing protein [Acidobacteriota bacterium]
MKILRKTIFWCHLAVGVLGGIVVLIMSLTGVLLTYQRQITSWADTRNHVVAPPAEGATRLSVESLLASFRETSADARPVSLTVQSAATAPAAIAVTGGRTYYVNPYTGAVLGEGSKAVRDFFRFVIDWHRWLGANGEHRPVARAVTGACNLGFLFLVISGFYLWWPRKWTITQLRSVPWFKRGLPGKARDFNWHNVIGFWSAVPLFIVVLSAVVISYPWASNLVYRLVGEAPPAARGGGPPQGGGGPNAKLPAAPVSFDGIDRLWVRAEQQVSGWQSISLRIPTDPEAPMVFTIDNGDGGQPQKRATLTLERASGNVVRWEPFTSFSAGRRLRSILRFAHTGEVLGIPGQTIAGIASAGGVMLVWTGLALAFRRLRGWLARRSGKQARAEVANLAPHAAAAD